jgi:hypothetical protein
VVVKKLRGEISAHLPPIKRQLDGGLFVLSGSMAAVSETTKRNLAELLRSSRCASVIRSTVPVQLPRTRNSARI